MSRTVSVEKGVAMAIRRPTKTPSLLAKTLANTMNGENWIDKSMKLKFCTLFLSNHLDHAVEREVDVILLEKIKKIPFTQGIRHLKRAPEKGLKVLVTLVTDELEQHQKLSDSEQVAFYKELFSYFFPEIKMAELART